jgi:hypothetical protein
MLILTFLVLAFWATTATLGADRVLKRFEHRAKVPARFAPVFGVPGMTGNEYTPPPPAPVKRNLRGSRGGEGIVELIGTTTYGYQQNCTMGRQVEHRVGYSNPYTPYGLYIHFDWMAQEGDILGDGRGIGYQAYDITDCGLVFEDGGTRIESDYAGYVTMDAHNIDPENSWGVPAGHEVDPDFYKTRGYWDFMAGGPVFGLFTNDYSDDVCGHFQPDCEGRNIWPKISWDIDGAEQILHVVTAEFGGDAGDRQTASYYRRAGAYGVGNGTWSDQRVIDSIMNINVDVCSSPISDRVAIVWNAPVDYKRDAETEFDNQYENDVWYAICTDNGLAWADTTTNEGAPSIGYMVDNGTYDGGNITNYDPMNDYKAYCDMASLFAVTTDVPNDELHIAWGCRRWEDTTSLYRRQGAIFHWRESNSEIKTVAKADWDTGGATCIGYAWGTDVAKMSMSECDGKVYISFTQFGDRDHPCDWYDAVDNVVTGYLYISVYDPAYGAWDRPQRVTDVVEGPTGCIPGDMDGPQECTSEYWGSMARYGRLDTCKLTPPGNALDIVYINDIAPGGVVQDESGVWATNPVNWVVYPCREAVPEPGYSDDAGPGYGLCYGSPVFVVGPTDDTTFVLGLENSGILDNAVTVTAEVDSSNGTSNGANTSISVDPPAGNIPGKGGTLGIDVNVVTTGEDEFTTVYATITVTHEAEGSPRIIPMCIMVTEVFPIAESAVIRTFCKRLKVYNHGQMSNNATNASLDFMDFVDPDDCGNLYLYDGSPIICRDVGGDKVCYFTIFDNSYGKENALRPMSPLLVDSVNNTSYTYASAEFITGDSAIGLIVEYFAPKHEDSCSFMIQRLRFWNHDYDSSGATLMEVAVGEALDWDIPGFEHASNNESGSDVPLGLIYQYCCERDPCDTLLTCERFGGIASWEPLPFKNYMTIENDVWVYSTGPYGDSAPLPPGPTYDLMNTNDGFSTASLDSCEDLMTLVTFGVYDLAVHDTNCVVKILSTTRQDGNAVTLKENVGKANVFIAAHEEIQCDTQGPCDCLPGDANGDGSINVGDAVYLISFVFKGGPAPVPYATCSGDANCDCAANVGDAVYIIAYVFKGGPPPCECEVWRDPGNCGPDLYK